MAINFAFWTNMLLFTTFCKLTALSPHFASLDLLVWDKFLESWVFDAYLTQNYCESQNKLKIMDPSL
jgi:hypothetical protein